MFVQETSVKVEAGLLGAFNTTLREGSEKKQLSKCKLSVCLLGLVWADAWAVKATAVRGKKKTKHYTTLQIQPAGKKPSILALYETK